MKSSWLVGCAIALGLMLLVIPSVSAHAELGSCTPGFNTVLTKAPKEIRCIFSDTVVPAESLLSVFDANNNQVDNKDTRLDSADEDDMTLIVSLDTSKLANGTYRVQWVSIAEADGHRSEGQWTFSINGETSAPGSTPPLADKAPPVEVAPIPASAMPGPSADDLPEGNGGVLIRNYYGQPLTFTMDNSEYSVPANDKLFVIVRPGRYTYSGNVFGDDFTEVMDVVDVTAGNIVERAFFQTRWPGAGSPEDEGGDDE